LFGAETWTFWKVDQKYLENSEMIFWRMMEKIIWNDRVWNEEELHSLKDDRNILLTVNRKVTVLVTSCVGTALWYTLVNKYRGKEELSGSRWRRRKQLLDDLTETI
jgi:G:T/U-mismatch repair DNA glycosylase